MTVYNIYTCILLQDRKIDCTRIPKLMSMIDYDWYEIISLYDRQSSINSEGNCNNGTFCWGIQKDSISVLQFVNFYSTPIKLSLFRWKDLNFNHFLLTGLKSYRRSTNRPIFSCTKTTGIDNEVE